jgi:hypothetical protein
VPRTTAVCFRDGLPKGKGKANKRDSEATPRTLHGSAGRSITVTESRPDAGTTKAGHAVWAVPPSDDAVAYCRSVGPVSDTGYRTY